MPKLLFETVLSVFYFGAFAAFHRYYSPVDVLQNFNVHPTSPSKKAELPVRLSGLWMNFRKPSYWPSFQRAGEPNFVVGCKLFDLVFLSRTSHSQRYSFRPAFSEVEKSQLPAFFRQRASSTSVECGRVFSPPASPIPQITTS